MQVKDITKVDIIKLKLDVDNPRFAELYNGSDNQDELIEYLLNSESAIDIVKELDESQEYYADRPLWVIADKGGNYLVKDGNRRFAAVLALRRPHAFGLSEKRQTIDEVPVIIYPSEDEVDGRIRMEHTHSSFREWDRIAKALEVYKMRSSGTAIDSPILKELDSTPQSLVKLASFYYEAVKIGGEDLKKLLRRGRGTNGGKTIVFERLFSYRTTCGYDFSGKPTYEIVTTDRKLFDSYVKAMVGYLKDNPDTTHKTIDDDKETFFSKLEPYGFKPSKRPVSGKTTKTSGGAVVEIPTTPPEETSKGSSRKSIKKAPKCTRKGIPRTVDKLVFECYNLDALYFTNSKVAMTRVTFECVMKYVVENTEYATGKKLKQSSYFRNAYFDRHGNALPTTNFDKLKELFGQLILDTGIRKAFTDFDLDRPHQIIHNYNVGAVPADATAITDNLIPLIEFMLQEEQELLDGLDKNKL
jgi:hypothetical protein